MSAPQAARRWHAGSGAGARQWQDQDWSPVDLCAGLENAAPHPRTWAVLSDMPPTWRRWPTLVMKSTKACSNGVVLSTRSCFHSPPSTNDCRRNPASQTWGTCQSTRGSCRLRKCPSSFLIGHLMPPHICQHGQVRTLTEKQADGSLVFCPCIRSPSLPDNSCRRCSNKWARCTLSCRWIPAYMYWACQRATGHSYNRFAINL